MQLFECKNFFLKTPKSYNSDIFIIGDFNNNEISEKYKLLRKLDKNYYGKELILFVSTF